MSQVLARPETVFVRGGTCETVLLHEGDRLTVRDVEGGQACEIDGETVLDSGNPPGTAATLFVEKAGPRRIFAVGAAMMPHEQNAPADLRVEILRGNAAPHAPPPPLAEPKLDLLVPAAEARSYLVKAGDYIQIVDIDGQQCSDFLAFDAETLAAGVEHGLDSTTTRTLNHSVYPGPGLFAKFFDERMQGMVEVVRDTCGRHDTFGLACTSKGYADMGYPGHANCTDNFNMALAEHGVKPRKGWPAINFFYNTQVDASGAIMADEAWSRPGDYVLLRALKDLVCATSSCADDVGTTNAYNPTDIQVRIYDGSENFSKGVVQRMTVDAEARLSRESGFHPRTSALTRNFVETNGFWLPQCYTGAGPVAEYTACRERAALIDLSSLRKFEDAQPAQVERGAGGVYRDVLRTWRYDR